MSRKVLITDYAWPDLDIEQRILSEIGATLTVAENTQPETLRSAMADADAVLVCWAPLTRRVLESAERCRIVARLGIGLDNIDVDCCTERAILVTNVPDYCVVEVAEHALACILALGRRLTDYHLQTSQGRYDLTEFPPPQRLEGRTVGVVGWGAIGRRLGAKASALGMTVLGHGRNLGDAPEGVQFCSLEELLRNSDFVSLHASLTDQSHHLIGAAELRQMKPTALLINTARGGLVDHQALSDALNAGQLAGAALDVQDPEPPDLTVPPWNHPAVLVTPHAAFLSDESLYELRTRAARQVVNLLRGRHPENAVNGPF